MSPKTPRIKDTQSEKNPASDVMKLAGVYQSGIKAGADKIVKTIRWKLPRPSFKLPKFKLSKIKLPRLNLFGARTTSIRPHLTEADLINAESSLGGTLFGPIPTGHRREFFRFRPNVWIYHEAWTENGRSLETTITYEVRHGGVFKSPLGGEYVKLKGGELDNFCLATKEYLKLIKAKLY